MGIPITIPILNILLPTTLPIAISYSPFLVAVILVTNSGSDVPKAITVNATSLSVTPIALAMKLALSTTKLLPNIIPAKPITVNIIDLGRDNIFSSLLVSIFFLDIDIHHCN